MSESEARFLSKIENAFKNLGQKFTGSLKNVFRNAAGVLDDISSKLSPEFATAGGPSIKGESTFFRDTVDDFISKIEGKRGGSSGIKSVNKADILKNAGLDKTKVDEIVSIPKGSRPDPSTYLSKEYIDAHLSQFDDGLSVIQTEWAYGRYLEINGFVGVPDDNTLFVMPKKYCDKVVAKANGNISIIEKELGFPNGYFSDGGGLVRIDVDDVAGLNLRLPSGSETGANSLWIPGGYTSGDVPEAISDIIPLNQTTISRINVD